MSGWLLDTNVLSELRKPDASRQVCAWVAAQSPHQLYTCSVTFAEIRFGIATVDDPIKRHELNVWLDSKLRPWFANRMLEVDEDVIVRWREMVEQGRKSGITFSQPDLFIAAIADVNGLCVATRNVRDFKMCGVAVFNPWQP